MKNFLIQLMLVLGLAPALFAQGQKAEVNAWLSSSVVKLGADVELVVVVEGALEGRIRKLPEVEGITYRGVVGPAIERFQSSFNGRRTVSQKATWRVPLSVAAVGEYTLPPFEIEVGAEVFETRPMRLTVREDLQGAELGFLELSVQPARVVDGQPFTVEVLLGWDEGLGQRVNSANLMLPWFERLPGAIEIEGDKSFSGQLVTIGLNEGGRIDVEALGVVPRDGKRYVMYRMVRHFLATSPGALEFPQSTLEFGRMSRGSLFETAKAIEMYYKAAPPTRLEILPLPEEGRPIEFSGAVGTIAGRAEVPRREVDVGDSLKVQVTWTGDGNLEFFALPDLTHAPGFEGFRFYGATDERKSRHERVATFDLAPLEAGITEIPAIPLTLFDPELGAYRTESTAPIPIRVHGLAGSGGLAELDEPEPVEDIRDLMTTLATSTEGADQRGFGSGVAMLGSAAGLFVAATLLRPRMRRGGDPSAPAERRRARALKALRKELGKATGASERLGAFCRFLAARTRTTADAWHGGRLAQLGAGIGLEGELEPELVQRTDRTLEALEVVAWGVGQGAQPSDDELVALARELQGGGL